MDSYYRITYKNGVAIGHQPMPDFPPASKMRSNKLAQLIFPPDTVARLEALEDPFSICSGKTTADALAKICESMKNPNVEISLKQPGAFGTQKTKDFTSAVKEIIEKLEFQFFTFNSAKQTIKFDI